MRELVCSLTQNFQSVLGKTGGVPTLLRSFSALILSEAIRRDNQAPDLERILGAVESKIAPPGEHFYVYGEPERLDRRVGAASRRPRSAEELDQHLQEPERAGLAE
jgi:hypothetical protein